MRGQACADKGLVEEGGEWWRCVWWRDAVWLVIVAGEQIYLREDKNYHPCVRIDLQQKSVTFSADTHVTALAATV